MSVEIEFKNKILHVTLSRAEKRNAMTPEMIARLTQIFSKEIGKSKAIAVYLSGQGASFSAGADLEYMRSTAKFKKTGNLKDASRLYAMFKSVFDCPVPLLVKAHGHAMGGALGLLSCADIAAAQEGTIFAFSEVKLGLAPAVISSFVFQKMSMATLAQAMLTGEKFSANKAYESGLVNFVGSAEAVDAYISMQIDHLKRAGPEALIATKKLIRRLQQRPTMESMKTYTTKLIADRRGSKEGQEGLSAFLENRPAAWWKDL